ncbi:alcohol dehydrogenase catalytic domain-containing protein [Nocardia sp. CA-151230]|uniref:alcohol dehydrogenase catalytic domain-containing protein n=1 Tax=Nocardia sp. CA-151230 TaxID=3239982 RepID=UPI003D8C2EF4
MAGRANWYVAITGWNRSARPGCSSRFIPVPGRDLHSRSGRVRTVSRRGRWSLPMPRQQGRKVSGTVVAVGTAVTRFRPGQPVVAVVNPRTRTRRRLTAFEQSL